MALIPGEPVDEIHSQTIRLGEKQAMVTINYAMLDLPGPGDLLAQYNRFAEANGLALTYDGADRGNEAHWKPIVKEMQIPGLQEMLAFQTLTGGVSGLVARLGDDSTPCLRYVMLLEKAGGRDARELLQNYLDFAPNCD